MSGGVTLRDLSVAYSGGPEVVRAVNADCPRGEVTAVVGPNGAGKSSLLKAIIGLLPSQGEIRIDGRRLSDLSARARARAVAYVPQRSRLDARLRVREVVDQGRFPHRAPLVSPSPTDRVVTEHALREVDALHLADRPFPDVSGGEQQKVLIARALATEARILLFDEPTAALDARHVLILHRLFRRLAGRGFCVVVVAHSLDEVHRHADRALLLHRGHVLHAGAAREVVSAGPIKEVYGVDLREAAGLRCFLPGGTT
ncbi:MAG: ABC transporter ATP-binding protein [Myxococcota bacterium]